MRQTARIMLLCIGALAVAAVSFSPAPASGLAWAGPAGSGTGSSGTGSSGTGSSGTGSSGTGSSAVGDYSVTDPRKVYYGNPRLFQRPAIVSCDLVYNRIPAYQEIVRRGLTDKDPRYHLLMKKATRRFSKAVRKMARANRHDLVAERDAVRKEKKKAADIPNRTSAVIQALD